MSTKADLERILRDLDSHYPNNADNKKKHEFLLNIHLQLLQATFRENQPNTNITNSPGMQRLADLKGQLDSAFGVLPAQEPEEVEIARIRKVLRSVLEIFVEQMNQGGGGPQTTYSKFPRPI